MDKKTVELHTGIEEYIQHLEAAGQTASTIGTARRTLALLEQHMSAAKVISKIMTVHVHAFFASEAATTLNGKARAQASILQIRRIVRSALVWWCSNGYINTIPLPKDERHFVQGRSKKATGPDQTETE